MGLEVVISESLLNALQEKSQNIGNKLAVLGDTISLDIKNLAVEEAPHLTGNLHSSLRNESTGPFSYIIYPDEGVAPYALFVILGTAPHWIGHAINMPGIGWRYIGMHPGTAPNDFLQRAEDQSQSIIDSDVNELEDWCNNLDS